MKEIYTITEEKNTKIEIKKSKFIGHSLKVISEEEAKEKLNKIKKEYSDATHNCWAYVIGISGEKSRYNDDGEPHGTAGPPILDVLKKNNITNTLIVVTRYFGGIKLGAGGLVRAYSETAKTVLEESGIKKLTEVYKIEIIVPYNVLTPFETFIKSNDFKIIEQKFEDNVIFNLYIPVTKEASLKEYYTNLTNGKYKYTINEKKYI